MAVKTGKKAGISLPGDGQATWSRVPKRAGGSSEEAARLRTGPRPHLFEVGL